MLESSRWWVLTPPETKPSSRKGASKAEAWLCLRLSHPAFSSHLRCHNLGHQRIHYTRISTQVVIQISRVKAFRSGKCPLKDVKVILLLSRFFQEGLSNRPMQQGDSAPKHPRTLSRSRHYLPCDGAGIELERTSGEPCTRFQPSLRPCATSDALCTIHEAMFAVSIRKKEAWCGTLHRKGMCQAVGLSKVLEWVVMLRAFTTAAEMRSSGVI